MARIRGTKQNDTLTGRAEDDIILGRNGADVLRGDIFVDGVSTSSDDTLKGGGGADSLDGGNGDDLLLGQNGADTLTVGTGDDTAEGGAGADQFQWGLFGAVSAGARATISGGSGVDTVTLSTFRGTFSTVEMRGDLGSGLRVFVDGVRAGTIEGVERLEIEDFLAGQRTLIGGEGDDMIRLTQALPTIETRGGDDTVFVAALAPGGFVDLGAGDDILHIQASGRLERVLFDLNKDTFVNIGGVDILEVHNVEGMNIAGSIANDRLFGGSNDDTISGGLGKDLLKGRGGDDYFVTIMDDAQTTVVGGGGRDVLHISANLSEYDETGFSMAGTGGNKVVASVDGETLTKARSIEAVEIFGSRGDDLIRGLEGDDSLFGGLGGADTLRGNAGDDTLGIASGADVGEMFGGAGADTFEISFYVAGSNVVARDFTDEDFIGTRLLFSFGPAPEFDLITGDAPVPTSERPTFLFNTTTGELWYDTDGSRDLASSRYVMKLMDGDEVADLTIDQIV